MADDKNNEIPRKGSPPEKLKRWGDRFFNRDSAFRIELEWDDYFRPRAFYEGHQWLARPDAGSDWRRAPRFLDQNDKTRVYPVDNQIMPAVDNEVSRLAKRNSEFEVPASGQDPDKKAGAKKAQDILAHHNRDIKWGRKRRDFTFHTVSYGTGVILSYLETSYRPDKAVKVGVSGAMRCMGSQEFGTTDPLTGAMGMIQKPPCGCTLAEESLPFKPVQDMIGANPDVMGRVKPVYKQGEVEPKSYKATSCPGCGGRLEPTAIPLDQADGVDFFERPLGQDLALGEAAKEVVPWIEMFFENEGVGITPETCTEFGVEQVRSLKWVREHYNKNLEELQPDDAKKIWERFPWNGEYGSGSKGAYAVGEHGTRSLYDNHVVVRKFWSLPDRDNPDGRLIVTAGLGKTVILEDGDLMVHDQLGNKFPKIHCETARCFIRDNMMWGQGFAAHAVSDQNRINMRLAEIVELAERMGIISVTATRGMKLSRAWIDGLIGTIMRWEKDATLPDAKPEVTTGAQQFNEWMAEIVDARQTMQARLGINDVETGNISESGLKSGIALQLASEKTSERRQQREQEIVTAYEGVQSHGLKLIQHYYNKEEGRKYKAKLGTSYEERAFSGLDIAGQTDVRVREIPSFDESLAGKQTLAEAVASNPDLFAPKTPFAQREYLKVMGAPLGMTEEQNVQLDAAEAKFHEWRELKVVPSIDPNLDNHAIHWDTYGRLMLDHESIELSKQQKWGEALDMLAGWEQAIPNAQALSQNVSKLADMQGMPRDQVWQQAGPMLMQVTTMQTMMASMPPPMPGPGGMPMPAPPPPQVPERPLPPTGTPPPEALAPLVWWIWQNRLIQRGFQGMSTDNGMSTSLGQMPMMSKPEGSMTFETFAKFQAVREAHKLYMEGRHMAAQMGQPDAMAPGTQPMQPQQGAVPPPGLEAPAAPDMGGMVQ